MNAQAIGLLTPITYFALLALEAIRPARRFPAVRGWRLFGVAFLVVVAAIANVVPLLLPTRWLAAHRLVDGTVLGVAGGAAAGLFVNGLLGYWVHRALHRSSLLWRWVHQLHHAPQRVDIPSSLMVHPLELATGMVVTIVTSTFLLGLDPIAASLVGYVSATLSTIEHLNVKLPRWVGYIVPRAEAHCIHHQRGVHAFNYSQLPVIDMLFGTFRNPEDFDGEAGFGRRVRLADVLVGRDASV